MQATPTKNIDPNADHTRAVFLQHGRSEDYPTPARGVRMGLLLSRIRRGIYRLCRTTFWIVYPLPLVREILRELCSFPRRIGWLYATKPYLYGIHLGRLGGSPRDRHGNAQTLACIEDTQRITQIHRWANLADRSLFVEGWKRGAEWASREKGTLNPSNAHIEESTSINTPS